MSDSYREFGLLQRRDGVGGGGVCLRDSGILVECLASRFAAGESLDFLAKDYGRTRDELEAAMRLVVLARGYNLWEKRALKVVGRYIPILKASAFAKPSKPKRRRVR